MRRIALLGATGSIGGSTLSLIRQHPGRLRLVSAAAQRDVAGMLAIIAEFRPSRVALADAAAAAELRTAVNHQGWSCEVLEGAASLDCLAADDECDTVVAAIVGAAGLPSCLAAARAGKRILLANKEALVMAGSLFLRAVREGGAELLPVDSEHNAIFQCLPRGQVAGAGVRRLWLTASGGPFRGRSAASLATVTPDQACAHPTWKMGRKISVDSATLMNKGLEVIEAHHLFGLPAESIRVVIHPQSTVHSLVEYVDGSFLAQLGAPDMRIPIAHALAWPERIDSGAPSLDPTSLAALNFEAPDMQAFPCLALAYRAIEMGGTAPAILNAANEVAVEAFLTGRIAFSAISGLVNEGLNRVPLSSAHLLDEVYEADRMTRGVVQSLLHTAASPAS